MVTVESTQELTNGTMIDPLRHTVYPRYKTLQTDGTSAKEKANTVVKKPQNMEAGHLPTINTSTGLTLAARTWTRTSCGRHMTGIGTVLDNSSWLMPPYSWSCQADIVDGSGQGRGTDDI